MGNLRKYGYIKHENYDLCHRNDKKKISKLRFAKSSFGQKVWSTFPIAQGRVASSLQYGASNIVVNYSSFSTRYRLLYISIWSVHADSQLTEHCIM